MSDVLYEMFIFIFAGGIFDEVRTILLINPATEYPLVWELVTTGYKTIVTPLAVGLLFIFFLSHFISKASMEQVSFDHLFMLGVKLIAGIFLINHGLEIMSLLYSLGLTFINNLTSLAQSIGLKVSEGIGDETQIELWKLLTGCNSLEDRPGMWKSIAAMFTIIVPYICHFGAMLVMKAICWSRLILIMVHFLIAPIAFSDFFMNDLHGTGWKYLKSFAALCLQGFVISAITLIFSAFSSGLQTNALEGGFLNYTVIQIVMTFAAIAAVAKSLSVIKETIGTT